MALWNKLKDGIDRVEKVANEAFDEGKVRLDARRARQTADSAAQALGYAVFRAWEQGQPLEPTTLDRLARALRDHEQEARRLEQAASGAAEWRKRQAQAQGEPPAPGAAPHAAPPPTEPAPGPAASTDPFAG
jgi:hypothetical protein